MRKKHNAKSSTILLNAILTCILAIFLVSSPIPQAQATTETRYFCQTAWQMNSLYRQRLDNTTAGTYAYYGWVVEEGEDLTAYWGFKIAVRDKYSSITYLSSDLSVYVSRSANGEGFQTVTFNCPETTVERADTLVIELWGKLEGGSWAKWSEGSSESLWTTESLGAVTLEAATWTFYCYTYKYWEEFFEYVAEFQYMKTGAYSRIENIQYSYGLAEETNMFPVGFILGALIVLPIGLLIAKKH